MKEAAFTINKDVQDTSAEVSTSKSGQNTTHSVSSDTQNSEDSSKSFAQK
jgi:hypothetical protein